MSESSKAAKNALKKLTDQITCSICLDTYQDPKVLTCLHVFCLACLERLVSKDGTSLTCPNCRKVTRLRQCNLSQLQSAFYINHLFDIRDILEKIKNPTTKCDKCEENEAIGYCSDCGEFVCQPCINVHKKWKAFMSHRISTLEEVQAEAARLVPSRKRVMECGKHPGKPSEIYCETCKEVICRDCTVKTHRGHEYDLVGDCFIKHRDVIITSLQPLKKQLESIDQAVVEMDDCYVRLADQVQSTKQEIQREISQLQDALEIRKQELMAQVDQMETQMGSTVQVQREECKLIQKQFSSCLEYVSESLRTGTKHEVLSIKEKVVARVQQLVAEFNPETIQRKPEESLHFSYPDLTEACKSFGSLATTSLCPERCYTTGEGTQHALIGVPATFAVHMVDAEDKPYPDPNVPVKAELTAYKDGSAVKCEVTRKDCVYHVQYRPHITGSHDLHVKVYGRHIRGSPFAIRVLGFEGVHVRTINELSKPRHLVVTAGKHNLIITVEKDANCVSVLNTRGHKLRSFGSGRLKNPRGVTISSDRSFLVASEHCISKFTPDGKFLAAVGSKGREELQFNTPWAIAFNRTNQKLYVCDTCNHRIQVLNCDLTFSSQFGGRDTSPGNFHLPTDVAIDKSGNVYVADHDNDRIQVFSPGGKLLRLIQQRGPGMGPLEEPISVCLDSNDFLYVLEHGADRFSTYSSKGDFVGSFGQSGSKDGQFTGANGIAVDTSGYVYVSDTGNTRIQVLM